MFMAESIVPLETDENSDHGLDTKDQIVANIVTPVIAGSASSQRFGLLQDGVWGLHQGIDGETIFAPAFLVQDFLRHPPGKLRNRSRDYRR